MNCLRQKSVVDLQFFKYFLQLHHQLGSSFHLLTIVLITHGMGRIKSNLDLIHVFDLFHHHKMTWTPVLWIFLQIPEAIHKDLLEDNGFSFVAQ